MSDQTKVPGDPTDVIDIVNAKGEGARIRERDFPEWAAKGFVRVVPSASQAPIPLQPENGDAEDE
jgi:hypothetical protein